MSDQLRVRSDVVQYIISATTGHKLALHLFTSETGGFTEDGDAHLFKSFKKSGLLGESTLRLKYAADQTPLQPGSGQEGCPPNSPGRDGQAVANDIFLVCGMMTDVHQYSRLIHFYTHVMKRRVVVVDVNGTGLSGGTTEEQRVDGIIQDVVDAYLCAYGSTESSQSVVSKANTVHYSYYGRNSHEGSASGHESHRRGKGESRFPLPDVNGVTLVGHSFGGLLSIKLLQRLASSRRPGASSTNDVTILPMAMLLLAPALVRPKALNPIVETLFAHSTRFFDLVVVARAWFVWLVSLIMPNLYYNPYDTDFRQPRPNMLFTHRASNMSAHVMAGPFLSDMMLYARMSLKRYLLAGVNIETHILACERDPIFSWKEYKAATDYHARHKRGNIEVTLSVVPNSGHQFYDEHDVAVSKQAYRTMAVALLQLENRASTSHVYVYNEPIFVDTIFHRLLAGLCWLFWAAKLVITNLIRVIYYEIAGTIFASVFNKSLIEQWIFKRLRRAKPRSMATGDSASSFRGRGTYTPLATTSTQLRTRTPRHTQAAANAYHAPSAYHELGLVTNKGRGHRTLADTGTGLGLSRSTPL